MRASSTKYVVGSDSESCWVVRVVDFGRVGANALNDLVCMTSTERGVINFRHSACGVVGVGRVNWKPMNGMERSQQIKITLSCTEFD